MTERIAVIGAGVIGTSVAHALLRAGRPVTLIDRPGHDWSTVRTAIRHHERLARFADRGSKPADLDRLALSTDLADAAGAGFVIENVTEDLEVKTEVYHRLRELGTSAHIAANTSAIPIDTLAAAAPDPARVVGAHFMNPVSATAMVEVVRGPRTSPRTLDAMRSLLDDLGKQAVVVNDAPGFVINRVLMAMVNQAAVLVEQGVAEPHAVDALFKGCLGHAMGPLRTADLIGLDTIVKTLDVLGDAFPDPVFTPAGSLVEMVASGRLGMKSGQGFYDYRTGATDD
ncbi:3-hydroxyacyl-CoA dehydrogenase family protein [Kutzneria kofuensis]|uniref:3-hydroxybutyryl-CoA dehydrogenase n=2 Tax=Kutzneria kofuensis TaxID=103725 RepID=A0A7W9KPQ4_9PSEU|nr:3-hydroxyacyl-CoA dehydrogenase family protein [Kutzneria kofuensis]MBB5896350.1 3-hydroxybutyryl-CoA dehydrogenase [Kutzneria kofuensis]